MKKIDLNAKYPKDYLNKHELIIANKINEIIDHLNHQANGETPEVDNTVGQVKKVREFYYNKNALVWKVFIKTKDDERPIDNDSIKIGELLCDNDVAFYLIPILYAISKLFDKPVETE